MLSVLMSDVGDGMAVGIRTLSGKSIQIDCGSQQDDLPELTLSLKKIDPDVFILSHFHSDHYNGLLGIDPNIHKTPFLSIEKVFIPRIPEFDDRPHFLQCFLAMCYRVLGGNSGSMELDFLNVIHNINSRPFKYRELSAGDIFAVEGSYFYVLWPPRTIKQKRTLKVIKSAIEDFDKALEKDDTLKGIYKDLNNNSVIMSYLDGGKGEKDFEQGIVRSDLFGQNHIGRKLPNSTINANKSLRSAANHFSLAFHEDNRLLFLGDLESHELNQVVKKLEKKGIMNFQVIIMPHHGTHWYKSMNRLNCISALCSTGRKLYKNLRPEYKEIATECYATYFYGDVYITNNIPARCVPWWFPHFHQL